MSGRATRLLGHLESGLAAASKRAHAPITNNAPGEWGARTCGSMASRIFLFVLILFQSCNPLFIRTEESPPEPRLAAIAITRPPAKTEYEWGEAISLEGIEITGSYIDGSTQIIQDAGTAAISGYNRYAEGPQEVIVTLQGKTASFTVSVRLSITAEVFSLPAGSPWTLRAPQPAEWDISASAVNGDDIPIAWRSGADGTCTVWVPAEPGRCQIKASVTINGTVYIRLYEIEVRASA